jgi:hypothetical protein
MDAEGIQEVLTTLTWFREARLASLFHHYIEKSSVFRDLKAPPPNRMLLGMDVIVVPSIGDDFQMVISQDGRMPITKEGRP